jgi:hypothetical protein
MLARRRESRRRLLEQRLYRLAGRGQFVHLDHRHVPGVGQLLEQLV